MDPAYSVITSCRRYYVYIIHMEEVVGYRIYWRDKGTFQPFEKDLEKSMSRKM